MFRESAKTKNKTEAVALLNKRLGESKKKRTERKDMRRVPFRVLVQLLRDNHALKGNRSNVEPRN